MVYESHKAAERTRNAILDRTIVEDQKLDELIEGVKNNSRLNLEREILIGQLNKEIGFAADACLTEVVIDATIYEPQVIQIVASELIRAGYEVSLDYNLNPTEARRYYITIKWSLEY